MDDHRPYSAALDPPRPAPPTPDRAAAQRQGDRARRAEAARIAALVQYMLHDRDEPPNG